VLVGHSMGGLITRLLLQKDPHYFAEKITGCSWETINKDLTPEDRRAMDAIICLTPLPFVHRAIFLSVPHRGSAMADWWLAHFGSRITQLPDTVTKHGRLARHIVRKYVTKDNKLPENLRNQFYTGLDNLEPDSVFIKGVKDSPLKDDLVYHSIIGDTEMANRPGGTDGVVPYFSSHLDGAASELIVKSGHSSHRSPAAIQEILRILLLHLEEQKPSSR